MPDSPEAQLTEADAAYDARDWARAIVLLQRINAQDPAWAAAQAVPMRLAHCGVEVAAPAALAALALAPGQARGSDIEARLVQGLRWRAVEMCRAADYERASRLIEVLANY